MSSQDLSSQSDVVIKQLQLQNGMTVEQALNTWYHSRTKAEIERRNLYFTSGMRCYWELCLEMSKDERWMKDTFE